jgi:hypothetical protein
LPLWLVAALGALYLAFAPAHAADQTQVESAALRQDANGPVLDARIRIALTRPIADALSRGISQPFVAELEIERLRKWWVNETVVDARRRAKLGYHLLLRRYIVETDTETHTYGTLDEALTALGTISGWALPPDSRLQAGQSYSARLRLRIDTDALSKPLIIGTFTSDRWALASPWYEWRFDGALGSKAAPD